MARGGVYVGSATGAPPSSGGGGSNLYGSKSYITGGLSIIRGTILSSFQGVNYYDVSTDFGRYLAISLGFGRGRLGANEACGYLPGEQVWIAVSPGQPAFNAFIVGRAGYNVAGDYTPATPFLVYPQVSGFEVKKRFSGAAFSEFARIRSFNDGLLDTVDGDWVVHNMFGGAMGVEAFRSFLQAGPMSGVYCYSEDGHTRIVGNRFERITLSEEYEDRQLGPNITQVGRRVFYPGDAVAELQPQQLDISGPVYGGSQQFRSYPDGGNGSRQKSRIALLHEYRGLDGSYVLSSAASIVLQKTFDIPVPVEVVEADAPARDECSPCELSAAIKGRNVDSGSDYAGIVEDIRLSDNETSSPLAIAMNARGLTEKLVTWQARGGIDDLGQWEIRDRPDEIFGGKEPSELLTSKDPSMWKCVPQSVRLSIDPYGASKRFYLGKAMIAITEDGSIVLQDAHGDQITMSGGNIYLSASHDIIEVAGRNRVSISGRDSVVKASRHLDLSAQEGRITAIASDQATLMGGLNGHSGVLIESRGNYHGVVTYGENPSNCGALILKSRHMLGMTACNVSVRARPPAGWCSRQGGSGLITLDAGDQIMWRAKNDDYWGSFGAQIVANLANARILLGETSVFDCNIYSLKNLFYNYFRYTKDSGDSPSYPVGYMLEAVKERLPTLIHEWNEFANHPFALLDLYRAKWLSSNQYTVNSPTYFTLPEPEWQSRMRDHVDGNSAILRATMQDNKVDGTTPFPGAAAWDGYGMTKLQGGPQTPNFGDNADADIGTTSPTSLDGELMKGI